MKGCIRVLTLGALCLEFLCTIGYLLRLSNTTWLSANFMSRAVLGTGLQLGSEAIYFKLSVIWQFSKYIIALSWEVRTICLVCPCVTLRSVSTLGYLLCWCIKPKKHHHSGVLNPCAKDKTSRLALWQNDIRHLAVEICC